MVCYAFPPFFFASIRKETNRRMDKDVAKGEERGIDTDNEEIYSKIDQIIASYVPKEENSELNEDGNEINEGENEINEEEFDEEDIPEDDEALNEMLDDVLKVLDEKDEKTDELIGNEIEESRETIKNMMKMLNNSLRSGNIPPEFEENENIPPKFEESKNPK